MMSNVIGLLSLLVLTFPFSLIGTFFSFLLYLLDICVLPLNAFLVLTMAYLLAVAIILILIYVSDLYKHFYLQHEKKKI